MTGNGQKTLLSALLKASYRSFYSTFAVSMLIVCAMFVVSVRSETEKQALLSGRFAAAAFRQMILNGAVRDAEIRLQESLVLREAESVVIRKPDLSAIYALRDADVTAKCTTESLVCWSSFFGSVSVLVPIYFDEVEKKELFGYLELTREIGLQWSFAVYSLLAIILLFAVFGYRHYQYVREIVKELTDQFTKWAGRLEIASRDAAIEEAQAPYEELGRLQSAVNGFQAKIRTLEEEAKTTARADLLMEIGHDLRTPLGQLSQSIALHLDTVEIHGKSDPEEVSRIKRALTRMGELIRQLRALKLGEPTTKNEQRTVCDLSGAVDTFVKDFRKSLSVLKKELSIVSATDPGIESEISAIGFYRILDNLTQNALDASPNGTTIRVELFREGFWNVLRVSDEGAGVPEAIHERIFDFFTTKAAQGTGLGLGIVRTLCRSHGGDVLLRENFGIGATFEVRLPAHQSVARSAQIQVFGVEDGA